MTYRAGIIGAGSVAGLGLGATRANDLTAYSTEASHAGGYAATDDVALVAVADVDAENRRRFGALWDIPESRRYTDHEEMLERESLDVVSVCTPTPFHHEHVVDAATSPADPDVIWCEKPMATSVADAEAMIAECDRTDTHLVINHTLRFVDRFARLKEFLEAEPGSFGELRSAHLRYREELYRNSTHLIDMLVYLFDARMTSASGYVVDPPDGSPRYDDASGGGFLLLDNGAFVTVDCTIPRRTSSLVFELSGTGGKFRLAVDDHEWRYWRFEEENRVERPFPVAIEDDRDWNQAYEGGFVRAAHDVVGLIEGTTTNRSSGDQAIRPLEAIVALFVSNLTRSHVRLPLEPPLRTLAISTR